jgi:oxalate decarboxylase/phosphoglucose isomerase-like protein (cupin superfamily)
MTLERGALRELLARQRRRMGLRDRRALPRHDHRSCDPGRNHRFRCGRRLVLSTRPWSFNPGPWSRQLHLHPSVRQRLLLGVRHLLDHRLAWPNAGRDSRQEFHLPASSFTNFPRKEVYIATGPVPPPLPAKPAPGSPNAPPLTHRYQLLAQAPDLFAGGTMRIVSMREFPISTTMTGALLTIKPGSLRELHWHPNAAEWQYYLKGSARMTVFGSHGRARTEDFIAGDVGYVPQGYGHYIENTGSDDVGMVIVFNNATYESISITAWMAAIPASSLRPTLARPRAPSRNFPRARWCCPSRAKPDPAALRARPRRT